MTLHTPELDVEGRDWPFRHASRFVEHDAGRIHVATLGAGPALLLIHGTGASGHSFRDLAPLLTDRFTVALVDLPGQGFSTCHEDFVPTVTEVARVVRDVVAGLGLRPHVVVAHSSGAAVAVSIAAREGGPEAGGTELVVCISAALLPLEGMQGAVMRTAARVLARSELLARLLAWRARAPGSVERLVRSTGSVLDARGIELYRRLAGTAGHVAGVLRMLAVWDPQSALVLLPALQSTVLFIAGAKDGAVPLASQRRAAMQAAGALLRIIEDAGHLVHEEQPAMTARLIHEAADAAGLPRAAPRALA